MPLSWIVWPFPELMAFGFALPRMLAIFSVLPMFNRQALPGMLRIGVAGGLALFLVPGLIDPAMAVERGTGEIIAICFKEALIGFLLGFIIAMPIWAFEVMGAFVDNQRGASIAQTLNPLTGHESSPLGDLFSQTIVVLLFITGGFTLILAAIQDSYRLWPVLSFFPDLDASTPAFLLSQLDRMMRLAIVMSAPIMFAMLLAEIGLAIVSRFVPQLQVFFLAMPIKSGIAIFMFSIYVAVLFDYSIDAVRNIGALTLQQLTTIFR
ncbi:type III secretion system export apparatus subunit SctT [Noviherbaspirillum suwonense]|jgi:type III secretion protein T|nr:type III secretion system export apparatus subunit SctT [Noviherbaspirillum suwonense]